MGVSDFTNTSLLPPLVSERSAVEASPIPWANSPVDDAACTADFSSGGHVLNRHSAPSTHLVHPIFLKIQLIVVFSTTFPSHVDPRLILALSVTQGMNCLDT